MSEVERLVKCALCGTEMSANTQICPKCGSLNAHYSYHKHFGALEAAEEALIGSPLSTPRPALPPSSSSGTSMPPIQETTQPRHVSRVPIPQQSDPQQAAEDTGSLAGALNNNSAWQYRPIPTTDAPSIRAGSGINLAHYLENPPPQAEQLPDPRIWTAPNTSQSNAPTQSAYSSNITRTQPQPQQRSMPPRMTAWHAPDPDRALALELLGFLCLMGLGHWYGGHPVRSWLLMIGWWGILGGIIFPSIATMTPFALIVAFLIYCAGPIASGFWISRELGRKEQARSRR